MSAIHHRIASRVHRIAAAHHSLAALLIGAEHPTAITQAEMADDWSREARKETETVENNEERVGWHYAEEAEAESEIAAQQRGEQEIREAARAHYRAELKHEAAALAHDHAADRLIDELLARSRARDELLARKGV